MQIWCQDWSDKTVIFFFLPVCNLYPATINHSFVEARHIIPKVLRMESLDDVLVFSPSFSQHIQNVRQVLRQQRECGIKLRPKKWDFFQKWGLLCTWISAVTCSEDALPEGCSIAEPVQPLATDNLRTAQNADLVIKRVVTLKKKTCPPET